MTGEHAAAPFEPDLLWRWVAARSIARSLPLPVPDHGGMRVDTGLPEEVRRHVFAGPCPGLLSLAAAIDTPHVYLKVCAAAAGLRALLPPRWQLQPAGYLMTHDAPSTALPAPAPLPAGYRIDMVRDGAVSTVHILADDGVLAASGHAAEHGGVLILDRIRTEAGHRRRGLGRALVTALCSMQQSRSARRVLVATDEGCALYATLGWRVLSPYTTLAIPPPAP